MRIALFVLLLACSNAFAAGYVEQFKIVLGTKVDGVFKPLQKADGTMSQPESVDAILACRRSSLNIDDFKSHFGISPTGDSQLHFVTNMASERVSEDPSAYVLDVDFGNGQECLGKLNKIAYNGSKLLIQIVVDEQQRIVEVQYCNSQKNVCSTDPDKNGL